MMLHLVSRARHQAGSNRRKYANAYHNNHDGPPCSAYLFMFVVGAGMVITAILMLVASARHGREHAVDEYSHRISNWTHYRQQLQRTNFSVGAITAIESGTKRDVKPFFLPMDKTPEQQLEGKDSDNAKDLPPYKPLKYQSSGGNPHALLPTLNFTTTAAHAAVTATSSTAQASRGRSSSAQANRAQTAAAQVPNEWAQLVLTASYTFPSGDGRDPVTSDLVTAPFPLWTKKVVPGQTPAPERKCPEQQKGTWVQERHSNSPCATLTTRPTLTIRRAVCIPLFVVVSFFFVSSSFFFFFFLLLPLLFCCLFTLSLSSLSLHFNQGAQPV